MAKQPRVWTGTQWDTLAVTLPDLSNYSTTTQMNTAIGSNSTGVVISSGTFSSAATLSLSSAFSDTYKFYRLYVYGYMTSGSQGLYLRFRENTTDVTTGYYGGGTYGNYLGTTGSYQAANNAAFLTINSYSASETSGNVIDIHRPSATMGIIHISSYQAASGIGGFLNGARFGMTTFNGLTLYPASGSINGYYTLLGIKG